jgi:hypothetical protein
MRDSISRSDCPARYCSESIAGQPLRSLQRKRSSAESWLTLNPLWARTAMRECDSSQGASEYGARAQKSESGYAIDIILSTACRAFLMRLLFRTIAGTQSMCCVWEEASYVVYAHHTAGARVHYVRALRLANSGSHVRTVSRATWSFSRCCLDPDRPVPDGVFAYPRALIRF